MTLQELNNLPPDEREEAEQGADAAEQADQERADRIAARQREEAEEAVAEGSSVPRRSDGSASTRGAMPSWPNAHAPRPRRRGKLHECGLKPRLRSTRTSGNPYRR